MESYYINGNVLFELHHPWPQWNTNKIKNLTIRNRVEWSILNKSIHALNVWSEIKERKIWVYFYEAKELASKTNLLGGKTKEYMKQNID
jgi:hypothetical protein